MATSSTDYVLYVPENGHPLAGLSAIQCGDIQEIQDALGGVTSPITALEINSGKSIAVRRIREFRENAFEMLMPEDVVNEFRAMRDNDCVIPIQRRLICNNIAEKVHHYGWVSIDSLSLRGAIASGLEGVPRFPQQIVPAVFRLYQFYDRTGPAIHVEVGWNPVDVDFCDTPNCSACCSGDSNGCGVAFAVFDREKGDTKVMRLTIHENKVTAAEDITYKVVLGNETAIHCYEDKLYIGVEVAGGNIAIVSPDEPSSDTTVFSTAGGIDPFIVPPTVTRITSNGLMMFAVWVDDDGQWGVAASTSSGIDTGIESEPWFNVYLSDDEILDISAIGSNVGIITEDTIVISNDNGATWNNVTLPDDVTTLTAIALALPDFASRECPLLFVSDDFSRIFAGTNGNDWEQIMQSEDFCQEITPARLFTSIDGAGIWFNRNMPRTGANVTMKNVGRGTDCDWMQFNFSETITVEDCDIVEVLACAPGLEPGVLEVQLSVTVQVNSDVIICFNDGTTLNGYLGTGIGGAGTFFLQIYTDEPINCAMRGGLDTINCISEFRYPCRGWHTAAFAMCRSNPNLALLVAGSSCMPLDFVETAYIIKNIASTGDPSAMISCDITGCLPNLGCD